MARFWNVTGFVTRSISDQTLGNISITCLFYNKCEERIFIIDRLILINLLLWHHFSFYLWNYEKPLAKFCQTQAVNSHERYQFRVLLFFNCYTSIGIFPWLVCFYTNIWVHISGMFICSLSNNLNISTVVLFHQSLKKN